MKTGTWIWAERAGRWILGVIFLYAAVTKILDPAGFAADISHYALLPNFMVNATAVILPWIEAIVGLALISGFAADGATLFVALMLCLFLVALGQAFVRGLDINCGCFGHSDAKENLIVPIARDTALLALAAWIFLQRLKWASAKTEA